MFVHWSVLCPTHTGVCQPVLQIITIMRMIMVQILVQIITRMSMMTMSKNISGIFLVLFVNLSLTVCKAGIGDVY